LNIYGCWEGFSLNEVKVVVGILLKGNKFLVEHRSPDEKVDPDIVCLPGCHVELKEGNEEALRREMREELGIEVEKVRFVCRNFYVASNGEKQNAYCYLITEYSGEPTSRSAKKVYWESDIGNLSLEVDRKTIRTLRSLLKR
jgi:8-oxo-dGTP diphosphatase